MTLLYQSPKGDSSLLYKPKGVSSLLPQSKALDDHRLWDVFGLSPNPGVFSPTISLFTGRRNVGKTFSLTVMAQIMERRLVSAKKVKVKIASNFALLVNGRKPDIMTQYIVDEIVDYPEWAQDLILLIDELNNQALSRRSMNAGNVNFGSGFLTMIRKKGIDMAAATQNAGSIDQYVLNQIDYYIEIEAPRVKCPYGDDCKARKIPGHIHLLIWHVTDFWGQRTGRPRGKLPIPKETADRHIRLWIPDPTRIYNSYSTWQVIAPRYLTDEKRMDLIERETAGAGLDEVMPEVVEEILTEPSVSHPESIDISVSLDNMDTAEGKVALAGGDAPLLMLSGVAGNKLGDIRDAVDANPHLERYTQGKEEWVRLTK